MLNKNEYEAIKSEIIESCYKRNLNYSEFLQQMKEELEYIEMKAEMEIWEEWE